MKYYAGHENTYRRLAADGATCWDRTAFDAFYMRPFLDEALDRLDGVVGKRALDLGCGTGPATCLLAARGYDALGVDLAPTAIEMARRFAATRGLAARFEVRDVLELDGEARFDLVVDSHCLHCIVYDEDRARLLATVQRLLVPGGAFVVETMARHDGVDFGAPFVLDDAGVLWREYADGDPADTKIIDGAPHHPNRRVRAPGELEAELRGAGFVVEDVRADAQDDPREPLNFRAILRRPTEDGETT